MAVRGGNSFLEVMFELGAHFEFPSTAYTHLDSRMREPIEERLVAMDRTLNRKPLMSRDNRCAVLSFSYVWLRAAIVALAGLLLTASSYIFAAEENSPESCSASAESSVSYFKAANRISQLIEFRSWKSKLPSDTKPVFGKQVDRQGLRNGRCYWAVSVYEGRPRNLIMWHVFLVNLRSKEVLVQTVDGDFVTLPEWRKTNKSFDK